MFTHQCFIRKNSEQLRDKLTDLGYELKNGKRIDEYDSIFTQNFETYSIGNEEKMRSRRCGIYSGFHYLIFDSNKNKEAILKYVIDCGKNEDLFLAIAAMKDDNPFMQWFIYDIYTMNIEKGTWTLCDHSNQLTIIMLMSAGIIRKATVPELIEHFNK